MSKLETFILALSAHLRLPPIWKLYQQCGSIEMVWQVAEEATPV